MLDAFSFAENSKRLRFYENVRGPLGWVFDASAKQLFRRVPNEELKKSYLSVNIDTGPLEENKPHREADMVPEFVAPINREMIRRGLLINATPIR